MLRGYRIPLFGEPPTTAGGENPREMVVPVQQRLYNGHLTLLGAWECRPGFESVVDLGSSADVVCVVPEAENVAVLSDGTVYRSKGRGFSSMRLLDGGMTGHSRKVSWVKHDGEILLADGGEPMVVESDRVRRMGEQERRLGAPAVTDLGSGLVPAGTYRYSVTLVTGGGESRPGTESSAQTVPAVGGGRFRVYLPSLTDDERRTATSWRLYRRQDNEWGLVGTAGIDQPYLDDALEEVGAAPPAFDSTGSLPPRFRGLAVVGDYVVGYGHDATEFRWCREGNHDLWPEENYTNTALTDEVQYAYGVDRDLVVFKTRTIEAWALVGGEAVFARRMVIPRGCWARDSVVVVAGVPHWLGDDGNFYRLRGQMPEPVGALERRRVVALARPEAVVGYHYPDENVIRWTAPGGSWTYNTLTGGFSEDLAWDGSAWKPLAVHAVSYADGKTWVGMSAGRIGRWDRDVRTDDGARIRMVRRFTLAVSKDGRRARVNALGLRLDLGTGTSADTDPAVTVRWGFDQSSACGEHRIDLPTQGDTDPYRVFGPCGFGREMWIEIERGATAPFSVTAGFVVANPQGDGSR